MCIGIGLLSLTFCSKSENTQAIETPTEKTAEETLVQPEAVLTSTDGKTIKVIYFAEGDAVAVKLTNGQEPQRILHAKGVTESGVPQFTDGEWLWEIAEDGNSGGTLTEKNGEKTVYKK